MIAARSAAEAAASRFARRTPEGAAIWRTDFFGPSPSPTGSGSVDPGSREAPEYVDPAPGEVRPPQAFLVEQEPGAIVHAHFHFVDQFQVVVDGDGRIGKHDLRPVMAHFAGANTPYGPIVPGERGLKYFTFRASADTTGAQFMPASRARRRPSPWLYELADPIDSREEGLAARTSSAREEVLRCEAGLAILMLRIAPGDGLTTPDPAGSRGQSLLVTAGSLAGERGPLPRLSALFVPPDSPPQRLQAGAEGADVLLLQYPKR